MALPTSTACAPDLIKSIAEDGLEYESLMVCNPKTVGSVKLGALNVVTAYFI